MLSGGNDPHGKDRDDGPAIESAPLFTGVSAEDFRRFAAAARLKRFARGDMLYLELDTVDQVLLLISGSVKITKRGPKNMEVILRLSAPGDILDPVDLLSTGKHFTTAQAIRGCRALAWDARIFMDLVESVPVLHQNVIRSICGYVHELEERFRELATEEEAPRVARQLIRIQEQAGWPQKGEGEIGLSHEGLAQMTGTTVDTVSRLLSAWEAHGLITCSIESVMIIDVRALRKIFEEN